MALTRREHIIMILASAAVAILQEILIVLRTVHTLLKRPTSCIRRCWISATSVLVLLSGIPY